MAEIYERANTPAFAGNLPVCKAMKISSELFLCLGLVFAALYFLIFGIGFVITMKISKKETSK